MNILENPWFFISLWMGGAFSAALLALRFKFPVAIAEILVGAGLSHFLDLSNPTEWMNFLSKLGATMLCFIAGTEIEPEFFKQTWKKSLLSGIFSFFLPFFAISLFTHVFFHWPLARSIIAGIALGTTSIAIVYTSLLERGIENSSLGKTLLSSCFITDFGSVLTLGLFFTHWSFFSLLFGLLALIILWFFPKSLRSLLSFLKKSPVSEPEIKFIFFMLTFLGFLASMAKTEPVLPAFILGILAANAFSQEQLLRRRLRAVAYSILTPFFFMKSGFHISFHMLLVGFIPILLLTLVKTSFKIFGVFPYLLLEKHPIKESLYGSLLTSGGLTFGLIAAHYGIQTKILDRETYSLITLATLFSTLIPVYLAGILLPKHEILKEKEVVLKKELGEYEEEG
ncbi:cation:proton antiporter [Methylacidiphilum caldifontis]|uniref:Sodium:proton antiporter n=1 Tax=Methylacidiphilum caldifontis TaxID=2795386 RepID=A0A4Y8P8M9_9BACT|nr:cation:proton antiporter [Methylacidiphilum caldifontis]TFE66972.1 sodium:proton antiporter [Methylacidiphilum caldifontis]